MKVRARFNVKDAAGWHRPGDVFETDTDLGSAVDVLERAEQITMETLPEEPILKEPEEAKAEEPKEEARPARSRRKKTGA